MFVDIMMMFDEDYDDYVDDFDVDD
jgi:hypothetical protein